MCDKDDKRWAGARSAWHLTDTSGEVTKLPELTDKHSIIHISAFQGGFPPKDMIGYKCWFDASVYRISDSLLDF